MRAQSELGLAFALLDGERIVTSTRRPSGSRAAPPRSCTRCPRSSPRCRSTCTARGRAAGRRARRGVEPREPFRTEVERPDGSRVPIEAAARRCRPRRDDRHGDHRPRHHRAPPPGARARAPARVEQAARRASEAAHARVRLLADASALLERSLSDDESLQEVAELLVARIADAWRSTCSTAPATCAAPAPTRAGPRGACGCSRWKAIRSSRARCRPTSRSSSRTPTSSRPTPCSGAARRSSRWSLAGGRSGSSPSAGASRAPARARRVEPRRGARAAHRARGRRRAAVPRARVRGADAAAEPPPGPLPEVPGADLAAEYVAAGEGMEVGGDFYDVFALDDGAWALVIGDVSARAPRRRRSPRSRATRCAPCRPLPLAGGDARGAQRGDAAPAQPRPALPHRRPRPPRPRAGRRRGSCVASGGHPPPLLLRADGAPTSSPARGRCSASSPTRAARTARSSSARATRSCSTPTA